MAEGDGRLRWQYLFEWVLVPVTGLLLAVYGALSGKIDTAWIPVIVGFVVFPFARALDRLRRNG